LKLFKNNKEENQNTTVTHSLIENQLSLQEKIKNIINASSVNTITDEEKKRIITSLFLKMGGKVYFPRKGDNSERFDALIEFESYKAVAEIEIPSIAILDAPRNLLDDYAVLKARREEDKSEIVPLVICWDLPNKRTDYWNVISDINNILNLKIKTISVPALAILYWTNSSLNLKDDTFFLNYGNTEMEYISNILKEKSIDIYDFPGFFYPGK
jgi:hypothetical protein